MTLSITWSVPVRSTCTVKSRKVLPWTAQLCKIIKIPNLSIKNAAPEESPALLSTKAVWKKWIKSKTENPSKSKFPLSKSTKRSWSLKTMKACKKKAFTNYKLTQNRSFSSLPSAPNSTSTTLKPSRFRETRLSAICTKLLLLMICTLASWFRTILSPNLNLEKDRSWVRAL